MIARVTVALFAVPRWGFYAVCLASPAAWILADLFLFPAFFYCLRRLISNDRKKRLKLEPLHSA